eukprot:2836137-Prymnesium_polylepis.1
MRQLGHYKRCGARCAFEGRSLGRAIMILTPEPPSVAYRMIFNMPNPKTALLSTKLSNCRAATGHEGERGD